MSEAYYSNDRQQRLRIELDGDPESPRQGMESPVVNLFCEHGRLLLGDVEAKSVLAEAVQALAADLGVDLDDEDDYGTIDLTQTSDIGHALNRLDPDQRHIFRLPLYLYQHSGMTMSTSPFSDPFDSGQVGIGFVLREAATKELGGSDDMADDALRDLAYQAIRQDVTIYDAYLRGSVYGVVEEKMIAGEWDEGDSYWGFYGDDPLTNGIKDYVDEAWHPVLEAKVSEEV